MNRKIIVYQRIITKYRYELLKELSECDSIDMIKVISSEGMKIGAQKTYKNIENSPKFKVHITKSVNFKFIGEKRLSYIPIYPQTYFSFLSFDVLLLEGTTNIFNNIFLVPFAKLLGKKVIWWDSGYSEPVRSRSRIFKDKILSFFIRMTDAQMAYSSQAKEYMENFMDAKNCFCNLNTISTSYFSNKYSLYQSYIPSRVNSISEKLQLLFVGAIEERKKLKELISSLSVLASKHIIEFTIIGNGEYAETLKQFEFPYNITVKVLPPIYDFRDLEPYYQCAHLFVLPGEGGLAIIQAMQFGIPVLAIRADGTELDYIDSGNDGFICKDLEDFQSVISRFMKFSPKEQKRIYDNVLAKSKVINSMAWSKKLIDCLNKLGLYLGK